MPSLNDLALDHGVRIVRRREAWVLVQVADDESRYDPGHAPITVTGVVNMGWEQISYIRS